MVLGDKSCENSGVYGCSVCATCRFCSSLKNKRCSACIYAQHGVFPKTIECIVHAIQSRNMWVTDAYSCKSTSGKHYKKRFRKIIIKLLKYFHFLVFHCNHKGTKLKQSNTNTVKNILDNASIYDACNFVFDFAEHQGFSYTIPYQLIVFH